MESGFIKPFMRQHAYEQILTLLICSITEHGDGVQQETLATDTVHK